MADRDQTARSFPTADVLGIVADTVLGEISGIYRLAEFMCGEPIASHQLQRVIGEISPVVLSQHPQLRPVIEEARAVTVDNWQDLLSGWIARFGPSIKLTPMTTDEHQSIDPESELAEMIHQIRSQR